MTTRRTPFLRNISRRQRHHSDLRLTKDDLHIINNALPENRELLANLRIQMREQVFFEGATLQDIQRHQSLFDQNEVFSLLGDRYVLHAEQIAKGAQLLAHWRQTPGDVDQLNLQQTIELLAAELDVLDTPAEPEAITA